MTREMRKASSKVELKHRNTNNIYLMKNRRTFAQQIRCSIQIRQPRPQGPPRESFIKNFKIALILHN